MSSAAAIIRTAIDLATAANASVVRPADRTPENLRAYRNAAHLAAVELRKAVAALAPALRACPQDELMALDVEVVDAEFKAAAGCCYENRHMSEILMG